MKRLQSKGDVWKAVLLRGDRRGSPPGRGGFLRHHATDGDSGALQCHGGRQPGQAASLRLSVLLVRSGCTPLSNITVVLLFAGGVLYDLSVAGGVDVIPMFILKAPLKWNAVWVGYGNAAGYTIFLTSFLGVKVLSRYLKDTSLIVIGMVSFSSGMLIMAYVKWTSLFFIARAVMMFALIPLPMIRSVISKQISDTSYGKVLGLLQIFLTLTGVIASTIFLKIYMLTEDWYPSLCFSMSSVISCLSIIPIIIVERRLSEPSRYSRRLM